MKKLFFIALFILITGLVYSQDLIITNQGDSIDCKITKVSDGIVYFNYKQNDEIRNTLLPNSEIKFRQLNYYQMNDSTKEASEFHRGYQKFRVALNGGYSYRTAKLAEGVQTDFMDYTKELKSGYHLGADFTYFYNESFGFGFKYCLFNSSNSMDNVYLEDNNGNRLYGKMSDNIKISYFGPSFSTRQYSFKNSNVFYMSGSLGYFGYVNDAVFVDDFKISGKTLGLSLGVGYDVKLSEDLSLGFQFSILRGLMTKYDLTDGGYTEEIQLEQGSYESLNRIDFSVGLVFGK
jgi:hypothetical protein